MGEKGQRLLRGRARLGGEGDQSLTGAGCELHPLVREGEVAYDRMVELLGAGGVPADVVGGPQGAELLAAGGQLPDELGQLPVVRVAAGLGPQQGYAVGGGAVPIGVEVAGPRV